MCYTIANVITLSILLHVYTNLDEKLYEAFSLHTNVAVIISNIKASLRYFNFKSI